MLVQIKIDPATKERYMAVPFKGRTLLTTPATNKGTAFTPQERVDLDIEGILPTAVCTIHQQMDRCYESYKAKDSSIEKYIYLAALQDRNEMLFYRLLADHIEEMMPVVYTPVVGEACQRFSHIHRRARGLYVSYDYRDHIERVLANYGCDRPSVIVVTDGERILGLGDQGAGGMGISIGKLCLYTLCAGVSPYNTVPIVLDVGTDNEERLKDPLYLGLRRPRVRGADYQDFVDRFVAAIQKLYPDVLLQWEDFLKGNAIKQLRRFRDRLCTFNDDIQGTAAVALAGIYSGLRITGGRMRDQRFLFAGAGAAAQGISDLLVSAMMEDGRTRAEAVRAIWTVDSSGLVTDDRQNLEEFKATYARAVDELDSYRCRDRARVTLEEAVSNIRPTVLLGTSGQPGMFTPSVVTAMSKHTERPMIFPLSNPTSKSECTPRDAMEWSGGRAIIVTGSPFEPIHIGGKIHRFGQGNNAYIFPGVGLGVTVARARRVTDGMFLDAAKALAGTVTADDMAEGSLYPRLTRIRECSHAVACAVIRRAVKDGVADARILDDLPETVTQAMWSAEYLPIRYEPAGR